MSSRLSRYCNHLFRVPPIKQVTCFVIRTGEYDSSGYLTDEGKAQARAAAANIHRRVGDNPVAILIAKDYPLRRCYNQTARIIAAKLGAVTDESHHSLIQLMLVQNALMEVHRHALFALRQLMKTTDPHPHLALVVDGSFLADLLRMNPGPDVEIGAPGPPFGTMHQFVITYDRSTSEITDRRFV
jgi:hypothetical protein